ncbi:hypothetical protein BDP27DRAFT_1328127 [Rhodocollybia butyracea]|uniref:Uncharacterized protein n=1 Tax=Rhodocollybia butyracea TaxID=206335 RepID=A0A9P5PLF0_9AGAR|nr:hypothetical protein BDP27DRAFT_1328127 [Rhodocollybia butyracea]
MHYTLLLFIILWAAASETAVASQPLEIKWKHDQNTKIPFFLNKIRLEPDGPGLPTPVLVANSSQDVGSSSIEFNQPGLFEVVAVDVQTNQTMFITEINVVSITSSVPAPTSSPSAKSNRTSDVTSNHVAAVAGGVAGGITGLILLSITFILCWRRNRHKKASLQIPYPFYDEFNGSANGALVSRVIKPTEPGVQTPQQSGAGDTSRMVTMSRIEEKQHAVRGSRNGAHNDSNETAANIDGSATEVSEQPPAYTSECWA